jgi:hypothetical protein
MNEDFYKKIENSTAYRKSKVENKNFILDNLTTFDDLIKIAFNTSDKNHYKACWILELICEEKLILFIPYVDAFCETISKYTIDPAIRPITKICMFLSKSKEISLTENQKTKIIETCFDWLIQDEKVAAKAYSIRALFEFGKKQDWIYTELKRILTDDYSKHTSAYKAVAREILRKIEVI